jgi:copper chaperone CopZ|tara:strand:+ start:948 stop:1217 length:270 start_codon:yes stop_codon:yes gene_type:complete
MRKILLLFLLLPSIILANIIEVKVLGLVCSSCGIGIKKNLMKTKKVEKIKFDIENHLTYIHTLKSDTLTDKEIHKAIIRAGYEVSTIKR